MKRRLRNRLAFRLALGLLLSVGLLLTITGAWILSRERSHLLQVVETSAVERADMIRDSTRQSMLANDPSALEEIIRTLATQGSIDRIRVFDKRGFIMASSRGEELGEFVDTSAEQCRSCHGTQPTLDQLEVASRSRIFAHPDGTRVLGVIAPIRNEAACSEAACHAHPSSQTVLGVLDVQLSLAAVDRAVAASQRRILLGLAGSAGAMLALLWLLTWKFVLRPVHELTEGAARVTEGDLTTRIPVTSHDEIGAMTDAWNGMISELQQAHADLEHWGESLEKKVEVKTQELETAHRHLRHIEKMAALGRMASVVAHEINNPLTGIATYARLLQRKLRLDQNPEAVAGEVSRDELDKILGLIESEASRCGRIARDLLLFSRTPGSRFLPQQIAPLIDRCLMLLDHQARSRDVALESKVDGSLPPLHCDAAQMQQMLLALTLNAIEATPTGGRVTLSADLDAASDQIVFRVADTGCGIPRGDLEKIFEPFFTTKKFGEGIGLGLAVVYGVVKRHHGTVVVDSTETVGSVFTIRLPSQPGGDEDVDGTACLEGANGS